MACLNVTGKTTIPVADEADENASPDRSLHIYKSVSARNLRCNVIYFSVHPKASYDLFPLNSICNGIITFENSLCFRDDERERQKNTYMLYLGIETILSRTLGFFLFVCFFFQEGHSRVTPSFWQGVLCLFFLRLFNIRKSHLYYDCFGRCSVACGVNVTFRCCI